MFRGLIYFYRKIKLQTNNVFFLNAEVKICDRRFREPRKIASSSIVSFIYKDIQDNNYILLNINILFVTFYFDYLTDQVSSQKPHQGLYNTAPIALVG